MGIDLVEEAREHFAETVRLRRHFHMHPELSFKEVETPKFIAEYLKDIGIEVETGVGGNGVVGRLNIDRNKPTVALRADFDALPIQDEKKVPYKSQVDGVMHACGHDAHTAVLLTVAKILTKHKDELKGNVVFIFQHAEEVDPGGAIQMINDGCLENVDAIFGMHVSSHMEVGEMGYKYGVATGMPDDFTITLIGEGGHAAKPHKTIDPVAAGIVLCHDLQYNITRKISPMDNAVLSITIFNAGTQHNVIPDRVMIGGTLRTFSYETQKRLIKELNRSLRGVQTSHGVRFELDYMKGYPPVINDDEMVDLVRGVMDNVSTVTRTNKLEKDLGGEDFAYYLEKVPGAFFYTGTKNTALNTDYAHHTSHFDIDEHGMKNGVAVMLGAALDYLNKEHE
ncbi:M20 metallopeptidase family protein [Phocicoccus pinnipedialis]|uniref:Putative hydrolase YxeP n=1 Tax=Phocicoccus pinnipedialis TaxID=110845 RepID=A0A6V7R4P0_9BACL|nr:amidohydrolase [Jeotgalicoccus pinnipedialis]MBP1940048.1 amidohydrolase [Jeotgalicoccus pinnipedialis]CAD2072004.1 putative hydrolase YxeP [Jeotgalicoccus pinnipedialis]